MMNRGCSLCWRQREDDSEYCRYHTVAQRNLHEAFRYWRKALEIEWAHYLVAVATRQESGGWVREVAHHLLEKGKDGT